MNGKTNGLATNGSHKGEEDEEVTMDTQEEAAPLKSPAAAKGKNGRKSKTDSDTKSE